MRCRTGTTATVQLMPPRETNRSLQPDEGLVDPAAGQRALIGLASSIPSSPRDDVVELLPHDWRPSEMRTRALVLQSARSGRQSAPRADVHGSRTARPARHHHGSRLCNEHQRHGRPTRGAVRPRPGIPCPIPSPRCNGLPRGLRRLVDRCFRSCSTCPSSPLLGPSAAGMPTSPRGRSFTLLEASGVGCQGGPDSRITLIAGDPGMRMRFE